MIPLFVVLLLCTGAAKSHFAGIVDGADTLKGLKYFTKPRITLIPFVASALLLDQSLKALKETRSVSDDIEREYWKVHQIVMDYKDLMSQDMDSVCAQLKPGQNARLLTSAHNIFRKIDLSREKALSGMWKALGMGAGSTVGVVLSTYGVAKFCPALGPDACADLIAADSMFLVSLGVNINVGYENYKNHELAIDKKEIVDKLLTALSEMIVNMEATCFAMGYRLVKM